MNYSLAREIYGGAPWMVDASTFSALRSMLNDFRAGVNFHAKEDKNNAIALVKISAATKIINRTWQLSDDYQGDDLVYVINLNGVITKDGGESTFGMKQLAAQMQNFDADKRVKGGVIVVDSGGGSTSGMEVMTHAIEKLTKPLVTLVERGGVAASAAYGISSATDYVFSESKHSVVGSIGTMVSFAGIPNGERDGDNQKHFAIYATKSTAKNKMWEEAINSDNVELIRKELLDPVNEKFLADIKRRRPQVLETQLDGSVYEAGKVVGTLVDAIGTFDDAVKKVMDLSKAQPSNSISNKNSKNKINTKAMTAQELKSSHPETYKEIFGAGVKQGIAAEKDRVGSWMAHAKTDLPAVQKGIEDGGKITATARENFLVKAASLKQLGDLKAESAKDLNPDEATSEEKELSEADAFYKSILEDTE
ncbi:S49 family peptidase [Pedobacter ureilyticus]|uniref:S49 family peptidase n=1 Tax=Pedobacter ureilyticus TaxID=1393051 RepID=A0ABW9J1T3_9SPHI|nr:S49 family peptidase [Pedobacter helvus]